MPLDMFKNKKLQHGTFATVLHHLFFQQLSANFRELRRPVSVLKEIWFTIVA